MCNRAAENYTRSKPVEVPSRAVRVKACHVGSANRFLNVIGEADVSQLKADCPLLRMVNVGGTARCYWPLVPFVDGRFFVYLVCYCELWETISRVVGDCFVERKSSLQRHQ